MCETRRKYNSQQFDMPPPKGEVTTPSKTPVQGESTPSSKRRSPELVLTASGNSLASQPMTACGSGTDPISFQMSMKTVEMLALIKGTTPQEAYLLTLAEQAEEEQAEKAGEPSAENSLLLLRRGRHLEIEEETEDYLVGDNYSDCSEDDDACSLDGEYGYDEGKEGDGDQDEIFEIEM
eukprot:Colp12_sorted_trinity150504_noHs@17695